MKRRLMNRVGNPMVIWITLTLFSACGDQGQVGHTLQPAAQQPIVPDEYVRYDETRSGRAQTHNHKRFARGTREIEIAGKHVVFDAADIWDDARARHYVSVDAWESYLRPVEEGTP